MHDKGASSREEPVSLAPLTPEEALRALLAVRPDDEPVTGTESDKPGQSKSDA